MKYNLSIVISNNEVDEFEKYIDENSDVIICKENSRQLLYAKVYKIDMPLEQYSFISLKFKLLNHVAKVIKLIEF